MRSVNAFFAKFAVVFGGMVITQAFGVGSPEIPLQLANPASVLCIKAQGQLRMHTNAQGVWTECELPRGRVCEEWTFYHRTCATDERPGEE